MTKRATIQLLLLVLSVAFEAVRQGQGVGCYSLLCIEQIYLRSFLYFIIEHFIIIVLAIMVWQNSQQDEDIKTDRFFVILCVADLLDYLVTGNNLWFKIPLTYSETSWFFIVPFSMNVFSVVCFIIYANRQWKTNGSR